MKIGYIYKITNPSGKIYIGQTINLKQRLKSYKGNHTKTQPILHNSINKYGWDKHIFEIIDECLCDNDKILLNEKEIYWIKEYKAFGPMGLNCTIGGEGQNSRICSEETREKLRKAKLGNKNHLGHKNTEDSKKIMSDSAKKRGATREKGFNLSEETKEKIRQAKLGSKGPNNGRKWSEQAKENMRQAALNRKKKISI